MTRSRRRVKKKLVWRGWCGCRSATRHPMTATTGHPRTSTEQGYVGQDVAGGEHRPVSVALDGAVFFESSGALTAQALSGACAYEEGGECVAEASNVYEFEGGRVFLISDGRDTHSTFRGGSGGLVGVSPSGADVYFKSGDALVAGQGGDPGLDYIYDARVGGGFPAPAGSGCVGECQAPGGAPPVFGAPSSMCVLRCGERSAGGGDAGGEAQAVDAGAEAREGVEGVPGKTRPASAGCVRGAGQASLSAGA